MELVACLCRAAGMHDRRRSVTTAAALGSTPFAMDSAGLAGAPINVNAMLMNAMDERLPPPLVAALVAVVSDGTVVAFA
jgi:hypothetical protein